jgi:hypothetical protein
MSHDHSHHTGNYNRAFAVGILLNLIFVAIEAGYGNPELQAENQESGIAFFLIEKI